MKFTNGKILGGSPMTISNGINLGGFGFPAGVVSSLIFNAILTNTLTLSKGTGEATFSRASTASQTDNEGLINQVLSGEVRFENARRVENLFNSSEDFTNSSWNKVKGGSGTDPVVSSSTCTDLPIGTSKCQRIQFTRGGSNSSDYSLLSQTVTGTATSVKSIYLQSNTASSQDVLIYTNSPGSGVVVTAPVGSWERVTLPSNGVGDLQMLFGTRGGSGAYFNGGDDNLDLLVTGAMLELTDGQANQNPSEYVSNDEGTTAELNTNTGFDTDTDWDLGSFATITGGVLHVPAGGGTNGLFYNDTTPLYDKTKKTIITWEVSNDSTNFGAALRAYDDNGFSIDTLSNQYKNLDGTYKQIIEANTISQDFRLGFFRFSGHTGSQDIDNMSVKQVDHGSNVDGVKYFTTENGNTVTSNVVTEATGAAIAEAILKGVYIEGQRTNTANYSQDFSNAAYSGIRATITGDTATSPSGIVNAGTIAEDSSVSTSHLISNLAQITTSVDNTYSVFLKSINRDWVQLRYDVSTGTIPFGNFNLNTGVVGVTQGLTNSGIIDYGNGWYRCFITWNAAASDNRASRVYVAEGDNDITLTGLNQDSYYVFGWQVEVGSFPSSYIKTEGSTVTRSADLDIYDTSGNINTGKGIIKLEFTPGHDVVSGNTIFLWGSYVDASNYTAILHDGTNIIFRKRISGVNTDATKALSFVKGTTYNIKATYGTGGQDIYVDSVVGTNHSNTSNLQLGTTMEIGSDGNGANQMFSSIKNFTIDNKII